MPDAVLPPPPDISDSSALIGDYWSPELGVLYRVRQRNGKLWLRYPRGEAELRPQVRDVFLWRQDGTFIHVVRKADHVGDFQLAQPNQRLRDLRFTKVMVTSITR